MLFLLLVFSFRFFFFSDTATPEIYTLSLHDALPIFRSIDCRRDVWRSCESHHVERVAVRFPGLHLEAVEPRASADRKSTRLNSSHVSISYAVFCLKKKNTFNDIKLLAQVPTVSLHPL